MSIYFNKKTGENVKTWLDIFIIFVTAVLFLFIFIKPKIIKDWCDRGNFSECSFAFGGTTISQKKEKIQQGEQIFGEAIASINKIKVNLNSLQSNLKTISTDLKPQEQQKLQEQIKLATDQVKNLTFIEVKLKKGLSKLQPLVNDFAPSGKWAIVFGGDTSHGSALSEIDKAQKKGYNSAKIYYRQNSYRSVITFDSRQLANDALQEIRELSYHNDAYLVNLENWCPNPISKQDDLGQYFMCQS